MYIQPGRSGMVPLSSVVGIHLVRLRTRVVVQLQSARIHTHELTQPLEKFRTRHPGRVPLLRPDWRPGPNRRLSQRIKTELIFQPQQPSLRPLFLIRSEMVSWATDRTSKFSEDSHALNTPGS